MLQRVNGRSHLAGALSDNLGQVTGFAVAFDQADQMAANNGAIAHLGSRSGVLGCADAEADADRGGTG